MSTQRKIAVLVILVGILVAGSFFWPLVKPKIASIFSSNVSPADNVGKAVSHIKPVLPRTKELYQIAEAAETWPKILEAVIDPPDVHVGEKQSFSLVVQGPDKIVSVEAITKTDHKTITTPLSLTGPVSDSELQPVHYAVGRDHVLAVVDPAKHYAEVAVAADYPKYRYEGSWGVYDTHDEIYHTTFVVTDSAGRKNSVTMAWSDPCSPPNSGKWAPFADCTLGSNTGTENGSTTISNMNLNLNGYKFIWNPGGQNAIYIQPNGSISISTGSALRQAYICGVDNDGDLYSPDSSVQPGVQNGCGDLGVNYKRRSTLLGQGDCYDSNANAKPGQTSYFAVNRGDGSYDYDCDGSESKSLANYTSDCSTDGAGVCSPPSNCQNASCTGVSSQTPACGQGYTAVGCTGTFTDCVGCSGGIIRDGCSVTGATNATSSCR